MEYELGTHKRSKEIVREADVMKIRREMLDPSTIGEQRAFVIKSISKEEEVEVESLFIQTR